MNISEEHAAFFFEPEESALLFLPWGWKQQVASKCWYRLYVITSSWSLVWEPEVSHCF